MLTTFVITSYNRKKKISFSIDSVINQEFFKENSELIIVDDASVDGTPVFLKEKYKNEIDEGYIKLIQLKENIGVTGAKNAGYTAANGKWVVFLDCDDLLVAEKLKDMEKIFSENSNKPIIFFRCINQNGVFVGEWFEKERCLDIATYTKSSSFGEALTAINKSLVKIEPYEKNLRGCEGIGCSRIILKFGDALLSNLVARVYFQDSSDRLSSPKGFLKRIKLIGKYHFLRVKEFHNHMTISMKLLTIIKVPIYYFIGSIYSVMTRHK